MAKQQVAPVHVRLPPETLEHLRRFAAHRGETVHAEVVRAVDAYLAKAGEEPEIAALKVATGAVMDQFNWMAAEPDDDPKLLLKLVSAALVMLFRKLGADGETTARTQAMATQAVNSIWLELQKQADTLLGEAGRTLGVEKRS